jgi:hypothetical protein
MAIGHAQTPEELLALAKLGQSLTPKQRQSVVTWLEASDKLEEIGDIQLAAIFKCKPASIRGYRNKARKAFAAAITSEDAMDYMARFLNSFDILIKEARKQVRECPAGTGAHLGYMRLLKEVESEKIEKLQSIGVIPKELGRLTAIKEEWIATVSDKGVTSVHAAGEEDEPV